MAVVRVVQLLQVRAKNIWLEFELKAQVVNAERR
jgi:hypothetical protein